MSLQAMPTTPSVAPSVPSYDATDLTHGGDLAHIVLGGQTYVLRITRSDKLILTK